MTVDHVSDGKVDIPQAMIEAARTAGRHAGRLWRANRAEGLLDDRLAHCIVDAALAAAFAECEVREEFGVRSKWSAVDRSPHDHTRPDGDRDMWTSNGREYCESRVAAADEVPRVLIRRFVVVTPAQEGQE